jgi:hypothetical protein
MIAAAKLAARMRVFYHRRIGTRASTRWRPIHVRANAACARPNRDKSERAAVDPNNRAGEAARTSQEAEG